MTTTAEGVAPRTVTCPMCGSPVPSTDSVCRNCGGRMGVIGASDERRPPSAAARRSAIFGAIPIAVQVVGGGILIALAYSTADVDSMFATLAIAAVLFFLLPVVGGAASIVFTVLAIVNGIRGVRETSNGMTGGRGRAVLGLVLAAVFVVYAVVTIAVVILAFVSAG